MFGAALSNRTTAILSVEPARLSHLAAKVLLLLANHTIKSEVRKRAYVHVIR